MGAAIPLVPALVATVALTVVIGADEPAMIVGEILALVTLALAWRRHRQEPPAEIAVLGSFAATAALAADLERAGGGPHLAGYIAANGPAGGDPYWLGTIAELRTLVERHHIDLLLLGQGAPRMRVFDELERSCWDLPVRMCELSAFYERRFGQVPIAEINAAWLQCVLHPSHRTGIPPAKRALDLLLCASVGVLAIPLLLVLAVLIRLDGGPVLYRQQRVGERGRPFTILKLRTMRVDVTGDTSWTRPGDRRVTRLGARLRRLHVDELPQIVNVLRGEMSFVGPRPEQPHYVRELEQTVPFYHRRHQLRPGITGWAQVRSGYDGSELGTSWKLSHDLYYVKHRSLLLDLRILAATLATPFAAEPFAEPESRPLILGHPAVEMPQELQSAMGAELVQAPATIN